MLTYYVRPVRAKQSTNYMCTALVSMSSEKQAEDSTTLLLDRNSENSPEQKVDTHLKQLDSKLTADYWSAVEIVPALVRQETKLTDFLERESGDPLLAATRLARYWKLRRSLFGDRWLLAMTQVGIDTVSESTFCGVRVLLTFPEY